MIQLTGLPAAAEATLAKELAIEREALRLTPDEWTIPLFGEAEAADKRSVLQDA